MFPTLHSIIRDVLASNEAAKVQFILEPLALPQLANWYQLHGQRFIEQLSYLSRTLAFYINRQYQKILKLAQNKSSQNESLSGIYNPIFVSANPGSLPSLPHTGRDITNSCPVHYNSGLGFVLEELEDNFTAIFEKDKMCPDA